MCSVCAAQCRRTLTLAGTGIGIGAVVSFAWSRLIRSLLFGIATTDPVAFGGMALLLLLTAGGAGYLPARRASRTDPMGALRSV